MAFDAKYTFSPNGMTEDELLFLSTFEHTYHAETVAETERYGCGKILREYCYYPSSWPIRIRNFHGPSQWDYVTQSLLMSKEKYVGHYSKRLKDDYEKKTGRKSFVIQAPFWVFAKKNKITKSSNASGTLFFPSHSSFWTDFKSDTSAIINFLQKLPSEMQPISVCMFFVDVQKGRHKVYQEAGFPVYTAGSWDNQWFAHNFFEITRNYKYCLSNSLGSQLFYCTAIGIDSFIIDFKPIIASNNDPNILSSAIPFEQHKQVQKAYAMFDFNNQKDSSEKMVFAKQELGVYDGISLWKMSYMLYETQLSVVMNKYEKRLNEMIKKVKNLIKRIKGKIRRMITKPVPSKPANENPDPYKLGNRFRVTEKDEEFLSVKDASTQLTFTLRKKGSDVDVFRQVIKNEEYKVIIDLFKANNLEPKYIIDLGGNIGLTSALLTNQFPNAIVVSIEPDTANMNLLQLNAPKAHGIKKAIWSSETQLTINREFRDGQDWSIQTLPSKEGDINVVETTTIDQLMETFDFPKIDFLKVDIEGAEVELFASEYQPDFLRKVGIVAIEIHDEFNIRATVYSKLKAYGFFLFNSGELTIGINKNLL